MGSRKLGYAPELIFIAAAAIDVAWTAPALLGLTAWPAGLTFGIPTYVVFALAVVMALTRVTELGGRVAELERLLADDEDDILGSASNVWEGPIEAGVRDAIAGYRLAGYSEEEAAGLAREVLRLEVKRAGGWAP